MPARVVDDHAEVELALDRDLLLDEHGAHRQALRPGLVRHQLHPDDLRGRLARLVRRVRELDAAALAAARRRAPAPSRRPCRRAPRRSPSPRRACRRRAPAARARRTSRAAPWPGTRAASSRGSSRAVCFEVGWDTKRAGNPARADSSTEVGGLKDGRKASPVAPAATRPKSTRLSRGSRLEVERWNQIGAAVPRASQARGPSGVISEIPGLGDVGAEPAPLRSADTRTAETQVLPRSVPSVPRVARRRTERASST